MRTVPLAAAGGLCLLACLLSPVRAEEAAPGPYDHVAWRSLVRDGLTLHYAAADSALVETLQRDLVAGRRILEEFFGATFPLAFVVRIYPSRADMDRAWAAEWGMPGLETQCWMVAAGIASSLSVLTPRAWAKEACEHDPSDPAHVRELVTHELVHVYHGQNNPRPDFEGMDPVGWFPEGLAVYVSGQLAGSHRGRDREAIEAGAAPRELESAWSGEHRYGVSGSLVRFIDVRWGRETLIGLLAATTEEEILDALETTEGKLIEDWKRFVTEEED